MSELESEMVLDMLRRMQVDLREIKDDVRELTHRVGRMEQVIAAGVSYRADETSPSSGLPIALSDGRPRRKFGIRRSTPVTESGGQIHPAGDGLDP
jgi:hypothetical protein